MTIALNQLLFAFVDFMAAVLLILIAIFVCLTVASAAYRIFSGILRDFSYEIGKLKDKQR